MMKNEPEYELKCDRCRNRTPVRVDGLCRKCRGLEDADSFEKHDLSVGNERA